LPSHWYANAAQSIGIDRAASHVSKPTTITFGLSNLIEPLLRHLNLLLRRPVEAA
jgi:hypothetical protein